MVFVAKFNLYARQWPKRKFKQTNRINAPDGKSKQKTNVIGPKFYCKLSFLLIFSIDGVSCCIDLIDHRVVNCWRRFTMWILPKKTKPGFQGNQIFSKVIKGEFFLKYLNQFYWSRTEVVFYILG